MATAPIHVLILRLRQPWVENLTGTRGAYRPYNTTKPKYEAWEAKVAARG